MNTIEHTQHRTVLRTEAVDGLKLCSSSVVVDATFGAGGHSRYIYEKLGLDGVLIGIDADIHAIEAGRIYFDTQHNARVCLSVGNFRNITHLIKGCGVTKVDAVLADLGWRQEQFGGIPEEGGGKGFSFKTDEPLIMTYGDPAQYAFTAHDIVNEWSVEHLTTIIKHYGEERHARRIAHAIVDAREQTPIETSVELAEIIKRAMPRMRGPQKIHPATRTFQALRIAVNDELTVVEDLIKATVPLLNSGGRLAIITFHSLEDRIVKHMFRNLHTEGIGMVVTKKPVLPSDAEVLENPRARSAKLRIFEKQ